MSADYIALADEFASRIRDGALKAGDKLPPQRQFAYARNIAVSTASRVYSELLRRGLVVGEVGRGTFVAGDVARGGMAGIAGEPRGSRIDLEFNFPILPAQAAMIAKSLEGLDRPDTLQAALQQSTSTGTARIRQIAAQFLACAGWSPQPGQLVFTGNGRQSIAAVLAALVPTGGRCGIEAITYPFAKGVATQLGITLVPLAMDEHGVRPDAVQKAHRDGKLSAIYVQPVIHNPLGMTMPQQRRAELLRVAEKLDLVVIEDFDLRIPRRGAAACQPRPRALRGDRQPFKTHRARPVARLHRRAPAPARGHHGRGPHRRLDRAGLRIRCRRAADERRHRGRDHHAETHRCEAAPGGRRRDAERPAACRPTRNPITCGWCCPSSGARRPSSPPQPATTSR